MSMMRRRESERYLPAPRASKADVAARARSSLGLRSLLASYGRWQGATVCGIGRVCVWAAAANFGAQSLWGGVGGCGGHESVGRAGDGGKEGLWGR